MNDAMMTTAAAARTTATTTRLPTMPGREAD